MKIILVRHAKTENNSIDIMQGRSVNTQLNQAGILEATNLKNKLLNTKIDYCYTSPLIRTWSTAMILVGDRVEIIEDNRILERYLGELEGKERKLYDVSKYWDYELNSNDLDVEPIQDVFKRCSEFLLDIISKHNDNETLLIVSHGATTRCMHHLLLRSNLKSNLLNFKVDNCFCKEYIIDKNTFKI